MLQAPSPTKATRQRRRARPCARGSVSRSASSWQGWKSSVSALTTGTPACSAIASSRSWRVRAPHDDRRLPAEHPGDVLDGLAHADPGEARRRRSSGSRRARRCRPRTTPGCAASACRRSSRPSAGRPAASASYGAALSSAARASTSACSAGVRSSSRRKCRVTRLRSRSSAGRVEDAGPGGEERVGVVLGEDQRRREPDPVGVGCVEDEPGLQGGGDDLGGRRAGSGRARSAARRRGPRSTRGSAARPARELLAERVTWSSRPSASIVSSTASAAAQATGLPPKVVPWLPGWSRSPASPRPMQAPIGMPAAEALGQGDDVGRRSPATRVWWANQAPVRPMPVCTSSSQSSAPCSRGDLAGGGEVAVGRHDHAGLALDRLEDDRGGLVGDGGRERRGVAVRDEGDVAGQRLERLAVGRLGGQRERAHGAAVEGALGGDERGCGRCAGSA